MIVTLRPRNHPRTVSLTPHGNTTRMGFEGMYTPRIASLRVLIWELQGLQHTATYMKF